MGANVQRRRAIGRGVALPAGGTTGAVERALKLAEETKLFLLLSPSPLGAATVDSTPVDASLEPNLSFGPFRELRLNLRTSLAIQALNGPEDRDEDGIAAGEPPEEASEEGGFASLPPQLLLTTDGCAWLKYRLEAGLKAGGTASVSSLDFEFASESRAVLGDYRAHARSETVIEAVKADLAKGPRFAFSLDDVKSLGPGDTLAVRLQGRLKASATVSFSDVFSTHLGELLSLTNVKTAVALKVTAAASLAGTVSVVDDFVVAFTGLDSGEVRVALRKAKQRDIALCGKAGIEVAFEDRGAIRKLIDSYVSGIVGGPLDRIEAVLARADPARLSPQERLLVDPLLDRFGLRRAADGLARLRDLVAGFRERADDVVRRVAMAKIQAGFAYEYDRVSTETVLFQASLTAAGLDSHHRHLVWGRLDGALADASGDVTLERYLGERTSKRTRSWGFTLGLDKWKIAGLDTNRLLSVVRQDSRRRLRTAYVGSRGYAAAWIGRDWSWEVDFNAEMPSFSAAEKARVSEFDFSLSLVWHQDGRLSADDVEHLIDSARLWRVLDDAGALEARTALLEAVGRPCEAAVQVLVGRGVFRAILPEVADEASAATHLPGALASAMPWWSKVREFTPEQRRAAYEDLWDFYLNRGGASRSVRDLVKVATRTLGQRARFRGLAKREEDFRSPFTFAGLVELNRGTLEDARRFTRGFDHLRTAIQAGEFDDGARIPAVFGDLTAFWGQSHHVRAVGAYLLGAAARRGVLGDTKRSLTVAPDGLDTIVVASA
jgi:hypothetical protein